VIEPVEGPGLYRYIVVIESRHEWTPEEIMGDPRARQTRAEMGLRMLSAARLEDGLGVLLDARIRPTPPVRREAEAAGS